MTLEESIKFLEKNKASINYSGIAKQLKMDASNFHKVVDGKLGLSTERELKLSKIIAKLTVKSVV